MDLFQGSDFDYKAVYFAPTEMCLGLDIPAETGEFFRDSLLCFQEITS